MTSTTDIDKILIEDNKKTLEDKRKKIEAFKQTVHRIIKFSDLKDISIHNRQLSLEDTNGVKFLVFFPAKTLSKEGFRKFIRQFANTLETEERI